MKKLILVAAFLTLPGCDHFIRERIVYKEVKVIVPGKVMPPPHFSKPHLPVSEIQKDTPDDIVSAAYYESLKVLEGEVDKRDKALNAYRDTSTEDKTK